MILNNVDLIRENLRVLFFLTAKHIKITQNPSSPITRRQNFRLVQIETNCRLYFKVHLKWKINTI